MKKYRIEVTHGQDQRLVEADDWIQIDDWLVFYRKPATGGTIEYWRVRLEHVVSMETVQ
jgi:hypothetical protein